MSNARPPLATGLIATSVALVLLAPACQSVRATEPAAALTDGRAVLEAMHARYAGRWYRNIRVTQEVVRYDQAGEPQQQPTWVETISLPGRVRSVIGDESRGEMELYVDGAFHIIREGRVLRRIVQAHPVLHVGYDVYCQPPGETARELEEAGFDLAKLRTTTWNGQCVYVVSADEGDESSRQFWIDSDDLLCRRIITRSQSGAPIDIHFTGYEPFAGVWLCTGLKFYRDGQLLIYEWDIGHELLGEIDAETFQVPVG